MRGPGRGLTGLEHALLCRESESEFQDSHWAAHKHLSRTPKHQAFLDSMGHDTYISIHRHTRLKIIKSLLKRKKELKNGGHKNIFLSKYSISA